MKFHDVAIEEEGIEAVMDILNTAGYVAYGVRDYPANIPFEVDLNRGNGKEHCVALVGGDGEPVHISVDHYPDGSRITFIGQLAADGLQRDYYNNDYSRKDIKAQDKAFDKLTGGLAVFLKVEVRPVGNPGGSLRAVGELACAESSVEFQKYGNTSGKKAFEDRPAKLAEPEPAPAA